MDRSNPEDMQKLRVLVNSFNVYVAGSFINMDYHSPSAAAFVESSIIPKMEEFLKDNKIEDLYEIDRSWVVPRFVSKQASSLQSGISK